MESDDSLRERVYLAPAGFSTAGASDSYIYWAKSFSSAVSDVVVDDPEPGDVVGVVFRGGVGFVGVFLLLVDHDQPEI